MSSVLDRIVKNLIRVATPTTATRATSSLGGQTNSKLWHSTLSFNDVDDGVNNADVEDDNLMPDKPDLEPQGCGFRGVHKAIICGKIGQAPVERILRNGRIAVHDEQLRAYSVHQLVKNSPVFVEGDIETRVYNDSINGQVKNIPEICVRHDGTDCEINRQQSPDWESQVHQESVPWSATPTPSLVEKTVTTSTMATNIEDVGEEGLSNDRQTYCITIFNNQIRTTVTHGTCVIDDWIADIQRVHQERLDQKQLIVGIDLEWRPTFSSSNRHKVAVLQLCVECTCLIFQLLHADHIPTSLIDFLSNPSLTFVGVGIKADVNRLLKDHSLNVLNIVDLRFLAATRLSMPELRKSGMKELAREILGKEIGKPRKVTMSRWDAECLTYNQVQYASLDAFLSFQMGNSLIQGNVVVDS